MSADDPLKDPDKNIPKDFNSHNNAGQNQSIQQEASDTPINSVLYGVHTTTSSENKRQAWKNQSFRSELDEVDYDRLSELSLYMVRDFRYYFQHPYPRFIIAYVVIFCNFLMYAEDPVAHSQKESSIPVIGTTFAFICTKYPPNAWSVLKVFLWILGLTIGLILGKLIHRFLFNRLLRIKMFHDNHGSFMTMFFTSIICLYLMSHVYNVLLLLGDEEVRKYRLSFDMGVSNSFFLKVAATGTWCGDFFTAWMVTDMMLQEHLYPEFAKTVRRVWRSSRYLRIVLFWVTMPSTTLIVVLFISTDWAEWDKINFDFLPSNEISRAFLASLIVVLDITIVMQDWDFPHFINSFDIKLPGLNSSHIQVPLPKFLQKPQYEIHITGKWFNYGILLMVMLLDLNMWKNQIFYNPPEYGQYVDHTNHIFTINDETLDLHNQSQLTYQWRSTNNDSSGRLYIDRDVRMNSKYSGYSLAEKSFAFLPCVIAFLVFGILIAVYGRFKVNDKNPYRDRLKKKRRLLVKRSSIRHLQNKQEKGMTSEINSPDATNTSFAEFANSSEPVCLEDLKRCQRSLIMFNKLKPMQTIEEQTVV